MAMDTQAILQLAEAIKSTTNITPTPVAAVSFKAPSFWNTNARAWFLRLEASFATHSPPITNDKTKFYHVVQLLDSATSRRVQATIEHPPTEDMYGTLKTALLDAFEPTQLQKDTELLNLAGLGDKRPSEMLQYMRSLNSDPKTLFQTLFLNQLPPEVRRILAQKTGMSLDDLVKTADRILEVDLPTPAMVAATKFQNPPPREMAFDDKDRHQEVDMELNVVAKRFEKSNSQFVLCRYHAKFGKKCT